MMEKVTEFATSNTPFHPQKYNPTRESLQEEYQYYLAHRMIEKLHADETITQDEYVRLELKYREKFHPHLLKILPKMTG